MLHLQIARRGGVWIGGGGKLFEDMLGAAKHLDDFPVGQGTSARSIFNGGFAAAAEDLTFEKSLRTEEALVCFDPETDDYYTLELHGDYYHLPNEVCQDF